MVLQEMVTFNSFQSALRFASVNFVHSAARHSNTPLFKQISNFSSKEDVQRKKDQKKKKKEKECEQGGESDTFTPSCQLACGPLSLHYPALSALHHPPLGARV